MLNFGLAGCLQNGVRGVGIEPAGSLSSKINIHAEKVRTDQGCTLHRLTNIETMYSSTMSVALLAPERFGTPGSIVYWLTMSAAGDALTVSNAYRYDLGTYTLISTM